MFRFTVPDGKTGGEQQKKEIQAQLEEFIRHEALGEIFSILGTDRERILSEYDFRKHSDGKVLELQELERSEENVAELQKRANANIPAEMKKQLYERFWELGMMDINRPLRKDYDRIVVLGGSYEAVWDRTAAAAKWRTDSVRFIDGLSCYRPINPTERGTSKKQYSSAETEFGVMSDAVETVFSPGCGFVDATPSASAVSEHLKPGMLILAFESMRHLRRSRHSGEPIPVIRSLIISIAKV